MTRRRPTPTFWQTRGPCSLPTVTEGPSAEEGRGPQEAGLGASQGLGLDGVVVARVTVLFFASAREAAGTHRASFQAPTVAELMAQLRSVYGPELESVLPTCAVWVNGSPAAPGTSLEDGDEVAVLPPVSGGSEPVGPDGPLGPLGRLAEKHAR